MDTLTKSQERALSKHTGDTILEFYNGKLPYWKDVPGDDRDRLGTMLIDRLWAEKESKIAEVVSKVAKEEAINRVLQRRFKSLREKKENRQEVTESLQGSISRPHY